MDFTRFFDVVIGLYGLYFLSQWYQAKFRNRPLNPRRLLSTDLTLETCRDKEGLAAFLTPRALCFGLALLAYAAISFLGLPARLGFPFYLLFFAGVAALYVLTSRQARRRFWQ